MYMYNARNINTTHIINRFTLFIFVIIYLHSTHSFLSLLFEFTLTQNAKLKIINNVLIQAMAATVCMNLAMLSLYI